MKLSKANLFLRFRKFKDSAITFLLITSLIPVSVIQVSTASRSDAANATCSSSMTAQNNLKAVPAHGQVFCIDSGVTPKVDAAYVGYKITSTSGTQSGLWVELSSFSGGKIALSNPADKYQRLDDITNGNYKTAYYLLKATGASITAQVHTVKVWNKRPDIAGASTLLTCDFTFRQVQETIKANANKVKTVTSTLSPTTATLGGTVTINVTEADVGKVGSGKAPDYSLFWISPAAYSSWPTQSLRLESVTATLKCTGSNPDITLTNDLLQLNANTSCWESNSTKSWTSSYTFRIIGPGPSSFSPSPVAMVASGTQYKHSDVGGITSNTTLNLSGVSSSAFTVTVSANSTIVSETATTAKIKYTITMSTNSTTSVKVDEVVDNIADGVNFDSATAVLLTDANSTNTAIPDPVTLASESPPKPLHFIGPYSVVSTKNTTIVYNMVVPCSNSSASYKNTVFALIGSQTLGSSATQISAATVTTVISGGSCSATVTNTNETLVPTGTTQPASSISSSGSSSSATLNGYAYPYGVSGVNARFRWSTDANLVNSVTVTSNQSVTGSGTVSVSQALTGLNTVTTYYFRIEVVSSSGTQYGQILSFTTPEVLSTPTVVTNAVSNLTGTSVTLNGTVNPKLNTLTPISFLYCAYSAGNCDASTIPDNATAVTVVVDNGAGTAENLSLSGSGEFQVDTNSITGASRVEGLSAGTTYFYKVRATCSSTVTTYCPNTSQKYDGAIRQFTVGAPIATTSDATVVGNTTATLNGSFNANSAATPTYYFAYCKSGESTCTSTSVSGTGLLTTTSTDGTGVNTTVSANITSLTGNTKYYFQLLGLSAGSVKSYGDILEFTTIDITTSSLPNGSKNSAYSASIIGAGGSNSYSFTTASSLATGLSLATSGILSGTPTVFGSYSITVKLTDLYFGTEYSKTLSYSISAPVYTVSYNNNGGSGSRADDSYTEGGTALTLANGTGFSKTGHTFGGWSTTQNDSSTVITTYSSNANITVYAVWNINSYTLTYTAGSNGTVTGTSPQTVTHGSNGSAVTAVPNAGYRFSKWSDNSVSNPRTDINITDTITVTANFVSNSSYIVIYDDNVTGESITVPTDSGTYGNGDTVTISATEPSRSGYTFTGWTTDSANTGDVYKKVTNPSFTMGAQDVTFYAKWTANVYTLIYNNNNGTGSRANDSYTAGGAALTLANGSGFSKTGYTFGGWSTTQNNAATVITTYSSNANITVYAIWTANKYSYNANTGSGTAMSDQPYAGSTLTASTNTYTAPSGYTFDGWCSVQLAAGTTDCSGSNTKYLEGADLPVPATATVTLYAIWKSNPTGNGGGGGGGGGGAASTPVYVPTPPTITSISSTEVCAVGEDLIITGTNLTGATALIDGASARVISTSNSSMRISLPMAMAGVRTLKVTNADGSASTTVKYTFVDTPVYVNYTYPLVYKDLEFSYTFSATDAAKYAIQGRLPAGLTINPLTGEVSGAATVDGEFTFTIVASNVCGSAYLNVSMFIDKAIPDAYTCSVAFNVSSSNNISEAKLAALRNCLDKALKLDPLSLDPVIFLSGGVPPGLTQEELINHPRYAAICELLNSMGIIAQIIVGAFDGPLDQVQLMIYWPEPLDV